MAYRRRYVKKRKYTGIRKRKTFRPRRKQSSLAAIKARTHYFSRMLPDYHLFNASSGAIKFADTNGNGISPPSGYNLGATLASLNGTSQFGLTYLTQFNQVLEINDFTELFDRYQICGVKYTIIPMNNAARSNSLDSLGTMSYVVDYDDNNMPTSEQDLMVKQGCKTKRLAKPVSIYYRPKLLAGVVDSDGAITGDNPKRPGWLNCANPLVNHYGLKMWFNDLNVGDPHTVNMILKVRTKVYFKCKDTQ